MKRAVDRLAACILMTFTFLLLPSAMLGQGGEGNIVGHVKDSSGGMIKGATITVTNPSTGWKRTVQSDADGAFSVINLPPGNYKVETSYAGFAILAQAVTVQVAQALDLNLELRPAGQQQQVNVEAVAPLVETTTATLHKAITPQQVDELPIDGRTFTTLATLVPGVTTADVSVSQNYDPTKRNVPAISINGQSGRNLFMSIDGGDNTDMFMGGQNINLSLEAVQEFDVTTHDPKAQYMRGIGGVVTVVTKSGSNDFHGSGFGFFRNDSYEAIDHFSEVNNKPKPPFSSQQFGGTIGGPIFRDKLFFFYSYERDRNTGSRVFNSNGAFPSLDGTATSQPFRQNLHTARIDGRINDGTTWFARYSEQDNITANEFFNSLEAPGPNAGANETNKLHDTVAALTKLFGSNKVNDFRFHYQYWQNSITNKVSSLVVPTIILPDASFGASPAGTQAPRENMWQWNDDFSMVHGRHGIRFGGTDVYRPRLGIAGDFRHNRYRYATDAYDPATNTVFAGNSLSNFRSWTSPAFDIFNRPLTHVGFYVQDDIRLNRVTISAGLRYDYFHNLLYFRGTLAEQLVSQNIGQFPGSPHHTTPSDDPTNFGPRVAVAWDVNGDGRTVIRAGYGRIYDPSSLLAGSLFANLEVTQANGNPPFNFVFIPGAFGSLLGVPCATRPLPANCQPTAIPTSGFPFSFPIGFVTSPDSKVAYADQVHGGVSHQFKEGRMAGLAIDVDGVYSRTRKLTQGRQANFCINNDPTCGSGVNFPQAGLNDPITGIPREIFIEDTTGRNNYEALIISARKNLTKWYQLFASYTLSQATTDTDQFDFVVLNQLNPNGSGELGPTNFDERHRLVVSGIVSFPHGIQWSNILTAASARPYTPILCGGCDANNDGVPTVFGAVTDGPSGSRTFNTDGDRAGPRGSLRGNPTFSWDTRIAKIFKFERVRNSELELLFEVFNLTNKANFGQNYNDDEFLQTPTGGLVPNPTFRKPINIITPPLQGQFGVRFHF
jgi:carboxypeptidase family protein